MGVSFANNASTEKLQALYDESLAAKAAGGAPPSEGNAGAAPAAAPAKTTFTALVEKDAAAVASGDEISEDEIRAKVAAGLSRAQAIEVITSQRIHDRALRIAGVK